MSYIVFAWLTTVLYAFSGIIGKLTSKYHLTNPWLFNFVWMFLTVVFILPYSLIYGFGWPADWLSMLVLSLANTASGILFVLSLYRLEMSVLAPIYALRTPLIVILGVFLFKETLSYSQIFLISLIFVASLFVGLDENLSIRSFVKKDLGLIILTMFSSAFFNVSIKYASLYNGFREITFWSNFLGFVFALPTIPLFVADLKKTKSTRFYGVFWSSLLATFGLVFSYRALGENISISIAIMTLPLSMLIAIFLSVVSPKLLEKHTPKVYAIRLIAAAVMVVCGISLSV